MNSNIKLGSICHITCLFNFASRNLNKGFNPLSRLYLILDSLLLSLFGAYRRLPTKLQGRIDGQFTCDLDYASHPSPRLKGQATIKEGYLDDVKFFELGNLPCLAFDHYKIIKDIMGGGE